MFLGNSNDSSHCENNHCTKCIKLDAETRYVMYTRAMFVAHF